MSDNNDGGDGDIYIYIYISILFGVVVLTHPDIWYIRVDVVDEG